MAEVVESYPEVGLFWGHCNVDIQGSNVCIHVHVRIVYMCTLLVHMDWLEVDFGWLEFLVENKYF